jgi:YD repeat-containing protein
MGNTNTYTYDKFERGTSRTRSNQGRRSFRYNQDDTVKSITHEDGSVKTYEYDKAKRPVKITLNGETTNYNYDSLGNLLEASTNDSKVEYTYDLHANITCETQNGIDIDKIYNEKDSNEDKNKGGDLHFFH